MCTARAAAERLAAEKVADLAELANTVKAELLQAQRTTIEKLAHIITVVATETIRAEED